MAEQKRVLVIGGGIAGLTAARELARLGAHVLVAEKGPFWGGYASHLTCKATDRCLKCNNCLVEDGLREAAADSRLDIRVRTEVRKVETSEGGFEASLVSSPLCIDPRKCTHCGLCHQACQEQGHGAVITAPSAHIHPFYAIDPTRCAHLQKGEPAACLSVCPEGAIGLEQQEEASWKTFVDGIVVATGYEPFDPVENPRYRFQRFENMITAMDLEKRLRSGQGPVRPSDGQPPESVAFVQCVGSRDIHIHRDYCSRICCGFSLRMAMRLVHTMPRIRISVFYMDIQNFGKDFDRYYHRLQEKIRLLRGLPGEFSPGENQGIQIDFFDEKTCSRASEGFDLVVLSVGISPSPSNALLMNLPGLSLDDHGFLVQSGLEKAAVAVAGTAEGPMDAAESITHARRAALELGKTLGMINT